MAQVNGKPHPALLPTVLKQIWRYGYTGKRVTPHGILL
jgi:hypothetical protein